MVITHCRRGDRYRIPSTKLLPAFEKVTKFNICRQVIPDENSACMP